MTDFTFVQRAPHEHGFSAVFERDILPIYHARRAEGEALAQGARRRSRLVAAVGFGLCLLMFVWAPLGPDVPAWVLPLFIGFVGLILTGLAARSRRDDFNRRMKDDVLPLMTRFLGFEEFRARPGPDYIDLQTLKDVRIFSPYDRALLEDGLAGEWRGVSFRMAEVDLSRRERDNDDRNRWVTVFRGLVLEVASPISLPDTLILGKFGPLLDEMRKGLVLEKRFLPVDLGVPPDALPFHVYSTNPGVVRTQIGPLFLEKMAAVATETTTRENQLEAAFVGSVFHLALSRRDDFAEVSAFGRSAAEFSESCRSALADLARPARIIDLLIDGPA
jgi:hypothetical protein